MNPEFDPALLSCIEDAGLNASAPPQQRWVDGWLVRFSPGKAKRARCVNAVAEGRLPVDTKLEMCRSIYASAGLPLVVRVTPFSVPGDLDARLAAAGFVRFDDTCVMVRATLDDLPRASAGELRIEQVPLRTFAETVGRFRGSTLAEREAHAHRLAESPVPFVPYVLTDPERGALACGQAAVEGRLVGIYDVYTAAPERGRGLASVLCTRLLGQARERGATTAYLQVEAENEGARRVYRRLGFEDAYTYHYRGQAA
ncbi:MAG TPA: GNAT family N-acetyltransferase [Caldimonas sp.]|nr:GNAT family N-acetyltransferase [Caldimonas sp.]